MPDAIIDPNAELRDTLARAVCSFGSPAGDACELPCVWCLANADTILEVFHRFYGGGELEAELKS